MEPRDDFDRAGASVRERAARLSRGHAADEVPRLARRRRAWQGAAAGVATVVVVVGILSGLPAAPVDRVTVEPLAPVEPTPTTPSSEAQVEEPGAPVDAAPLPCKDGPAFTDVASIGTVASPTPIDLAREPLAVVGGELFVLSSHATPWFGAWSAETGWRCLSWPELDGPRLTIGGHDNLLLALGKGQAAVFDRDAGHWTALPAPPDGEPPLAGTWTGTAFLVVLETDDPSEGNRVVAYDPGKDGWNELAPLPVAVNRAHAVSVLADSDGAVVVGSWRDDTERSTSLSVLRHDRAEGWHRLPQPPLAATGKAAIAGANLHVVDTEANHARLDLTTEAWSEPRPTGLDGGCAPVVTAIDAHLVATDCGSVAVSDLDGGPWALLAERVDTTGDLVPLPTGRVATWVDGRDGAVGLLTFSPSDDPVVTAAAAQCADIADFGARLTDTGITPDDVEPVTPADLAGDVDLVVAGTLTGEVEVANGPGPAGESYLAYELEVTDAVSGDVAAGDLIRVSIAFDGDPTRSAALTADVPAGASVAVFAYEVTDAPGGWVAADGNGFAVACPGGPPLGQVGGGAAWSGLTGLDELLHAARH